MRWPVTVVGAISTIAYIVTIIVLGIVFDRQVSGHLKLAADANSVDLAEKKIVLAIKGMDRMGLCNHYEQVGAHCFTSVLYETPDEDVVFWRTNIQMTLEDLQAVPKDADHLTVSNTLMKVRETLLDDGGQGVRVTSPSGISIYPNNAIFCLWGWLSVIVLCIGGILFLVYDSYGNSRRW